MKTIPYIASILLFAAAVLHVLLFLQGSWGLVYALVLAFGIIYLVIGILLLLKVKYSAISGIIFPMLGIITGLMAFDPAKVTPLLGILGIIDTAVIILCSILAWNARSMIRNASTLK